MAGFVLGTGAEYQLSKNIVLGLGYEYVDLGSRTFTVACAFCVTNPVLVGVHPMMHTVQGRLTYRFD